MAQHIIYYNNIVCHLLLDNTVMIRYNFMEISFFWKFMVIFNHY